MFNRTRLVYFSLSLLAVATGWASELKEGVYFNLVEERSPLSSDRNGAAYVTLGEKLFVIGGKDKQGTVLDTVEVVDAKGTLQQVRLSYPVAFASAVAARDRIFLIGGQNSTGVLTTVTALEWVDEQIVETKYPSLPRPRMMASAAFQWDRLYLFGGIESAVATNAQSETFVFVLGDKKRNLKSSVAWEEEAPIPSGGRLGAVACYVYNEIIVAGGYDLSLSEGQAVVTPSKQNWGYSRIPRDGHVEKGWEVRADLPFDAARFGSVVTEPAQLLFVGGDQKAGTLKELIDGTKGVEPTSGVYSYYSPTDSWYKIGEMPEPVCGGGFLHPEETEFLYVGATTRTADNFSVRFRFHGSTKCISVFDLSVIFIYFAVIAAIGFWFARRQNSAEEYALGGRNVKWWAAGISMMASGVSTISFMAIPAMTAAKGLAGIVGFPIVALIWVPVSMYITFPLLRRLKITSTFEYLENRFGIGLRLLGSFVGLITQLAGRIGIVILLPALAISAVTNISPLWAVLGLGIITTVYSTVGGFEAVIWTDVTQGILMLVGFAAIGVVAFMNIDGGMPQLIEWGSQLDRWTFLIAKWDLAVPMIWISFIQMGIQTMSFASDQATAQRVLSTPMKDVRKLAVMSQVFGVLVAFMATAVGVGLFGYFKSQPEMLNPVMQTDQMVPLIIIQKFPAGLAGLLIAVLFAASMSTVSTSVNSCAVMFGEDFYKRFNKKTTSQSEMLVMKVASTVTGIIGTLMAVFLLYAKLPTLFEEFMRIMALIGGGFVGVYSLGMFTRRAHGVGVIVGVVASYIVAGMLKLYTAQFYVHWGAWGTITTGTCILFGYLFSIVLPKNLLFRIIPPKILAPLIAVQQDLTGLTVWDQVRDPDLDEK